MNFSSFSEDDFEMKQWVNEALATENNPNSLVMKLQLLMQEVTVSLEDTTEGLLEELPRVLNEIQSLKQEAELLKDQMNAVKSDITKVEQETASSMSTVVRLDDIKEKILEAQEKLKQADNWSLLNEDIDQLFAEQDIGAVSEKIQEMSCALRVLSGVPDHEIRAERLNNLCNKLEAILSPKLIAAFNSHDGDAAKFYHKIFSDMNRTDQLYNYYYRCHRTNVSRHYTQLRQSGSVDVWLSEFYSYLISLYHEELSWGSDIFTSPGELACTLLAQSLAGVELQQELSTLLSEASRPVSVLNPLLQVLNRFCVSLSKTVPTTLSADTVNSLARTIMNPYSKHLLTYGDKVKSSLMRDLNSLTMRVKKSSSASLTELSQNCKSLITLVRPSVPASLEFTNAHTLSDVLTALDFYFDLFCEKLSAFINEFRTAHGVEKGVQSTFGEDHWVGFQSCFQLLEVLGSLHTDLTAFDTELIEQIKSFEPREILILKDVNIWKESNEFKHQKNVEFITAVKDGSQTSLLEKSISLLLKPLEKCNRVAVDFVLAHIKADISGVHLKDNWYSAEGAMFSPSPLSYITSLGDYLLLIPQQLEPFLSTESTDLDTALRMVDFSSYPGMSNDVEGDAFAWLTCVCQSALFVFVEMILRIPRLSPVGCKQLSADISYISNVMAALEVPLSRDVQDISILLTLDVVEYGVKAEHVPQYLRNKIATMRNNS